MTTDLIQILLNQSGAWKFFSCALIFSLCWLVWRYFRALVLLLFKVWRELKKPFIPVSWWSLFVILIGSGFTSLFSAQISDGLEWVEQKYLDPTYISSDTSSFAVKCFETELSKKLTATEFEYLKKKTAETANKIGCTPLDIYEVAYSECGLNPFRVRDDGIAASWIQLTKAGVYGLNFTLNDVKSACEKRDLAFILDAAEAYLIDRAKGRSLSRPVDVYTCVFAPGYIGASDDAVLYSKKDGAAYYLNSCFDGYYTDTKKGKPIIMKTRAAMDGKITKDELRLHLELKKSYFLKRFVSL